MTTNQKFFQDIVHFNAIAYEAIDTITGDLNKNSGVEAKYIEEAEQVIGSSITENYDLASLFGTYESLIQSDNSELLQQSLQNTESGIAMTSSYPSFDVCTHISTSVLNYTASMSSSFLSGQIYSFPSTGVGTGSVISIPYTFDLSGNQFNSHLLDVPIDFAVYGVDSFGGTYTGSNLIKFDYSWSSASSTNLLIKLNYAHTSSSYYLTFYWGNSSGNFISTNYTSSGVTTYIGTTGFNVGIYTTSVVNVVITNYSDRKNFWSNSTPYSLAFNSRAFVDTNPYLWSLDRINANLIDGVSSQFSQPTRYPVYNGSNLLVYLNTNERYRSLYSNLLTYGSENDQGLNASAQILPVCSFNYYQDIDSNSLNKYYYNQVPLSVSIYEKNPKKKNLKYANGYSLIDYKQIVPSAFVKVITDSYLWSSFNRSLLMAKTYSGSFNKISSTYLNTLDNFIANFFFGVTFNSVSYYFNEPYLTITRNTLKEFSQPYGSNNVDPIEFSEYEEKSLWAGTDITLSKQYLNFYEGKLTLSDNFRLPSDWYFEIYKPIGVVCNGIDPYNQGTGLAFDYTLNMIFEYENQNVLNKTLYLMASKYLVSQSDYNQMIDDNKDVTGYYYLADPMSKDYNTYSVGSIDEFRLYGYAGYIPDLKDGVIRPILTRAFSPQDSTKYTYDQYVQLLKSQGITSPGDISDKVQEYLDAGNSFYDINLSTFSNQFVSLKDISICATNYVINENPYWNAVLNTGGVNNKRKLQVDSPSKGFVNLYATVNSGIVSSATIAPPYTISNIPVGYDCNIDSFTANSLGSNLAPGTYNAWIKPPDSSLSDEQPAQISYNILSSGVLDLTSIKTITNGGGFYFDFDVTLNQPSFSTSISTSYPSIHVNMDNLAKFQATVNGSYSLISMTQTSYPASGYTQGFKLNPKCFVGLGYTSNADVSILINNYPTVDSFLVSNNGLTAGALENLSSFQNPITSLNSLNYTAGAQYYLLFEDEIYNSLTVSSQYSTQNISYISLNCKLILLSGVNPSGTVRVNIYTISGSDKTKVATSDSISVSEISTSAYSTLIFPISYTFTNNQRFKTNSFENQTTYWVSIEQNLQNCFLSVMGSYQGITTSNFSISAPVIYNDPSTFNVCGGFSTNLTDMDLGKVQIGISSIFGSNTIGLATNIVNVYVRKDVGYSDTRNQIALSVGTSYGGVIGTLLSNPISVASLSTTYSAVPFTFNTSISAGSLILSSNFVFSVPTGENQVYLARSFSQYDVTSVGLATSSQVRIGSTSQNFDFVFNRLFAQVSNNIYAAFNFDNASQSGLAAPNTLRQAAPQVLVDGYWSFSARGINSTVAIYPRSFYSNSTTIGSSKPSYKYVGYTHNIYLNIGYNSNSIYHQESILLSANANWKATWMSRDMTNYKNFSEFNVIQQTYLDSIFYHVGLASTNIANNTGPKSAVFEGVFHPAGNASLQVPVTVGYGTNSGVQVYINGNTQPLIDTFSVISPNYNTATGLLTTSVRDSAVSFKIYYFTLSTAAIEMFWDVGLGNTLINVNSSTNNSSPAPYVLNSGNPIDQIVFMNVSKTQTEANSVNSGYPPGDSFTIRSS